MSNLDVPTVIRLHNIFSDKGWHSNLGQKTVHQNLSTLLAVLAAEERELILELCERYEWLTYNHYGSLVIELFQKLVDQGKPVPRKIYIAPVNTISDEKKASTKSGDSLIYLLSGFIRFLPPPYDRGDYQQLKLSELVSGKVLLKEDEKIFFIDDFLGSGNTFKTMYDEIIVNTSISTNNIEVLAMVAHQSGIKLLEDMNISYSVAKTHARGISDYYEEPIKSRKIQLMEGIEKNITTNKNYKFGYRKSEGLVTLIKTPNNTFPFFWMKYKGSKTLDPPFDRFQISK